MDIAYDIDTINDELCNIKSLFFGLLSVINHFREICLKLLKTIENKIISIDVKIDDLIDYVNTHEIFIHYDIKILKIKLTSYKYIISGFVGIHMDIFNFLVKYGVLSTFDTVVKFEETLEIITKSEKIKQYITRAKSDGNFSIVVRDANFFSNMNDIKRKIWEVHVDNFI